MRMYCFLPFTFVLALGGLIACAPASDASPAVEVGSAALKQGAAAKLSTFTELPAIPAGVAAGSDVVFVGSPLEGRVLVLSAKTAKQVGELPLPPNGFVLPFIMHSIGENRVAVLDAGGLPAPEPFTPANPSIYEYEYSFSQQSGFSATLVRSVSFESVLVGFAEDFAYLGDGGYLVSDAILGSIWVVNPDGSIAPGIVPKTFTPADAIDELKLCPTMPLTSVNGIPFLFSGSTLPGVSPLAVRDGTVYFFSPCARGTYSVPLASLFDARPSYERAEDIQLVGATPADYLVEELLDFSFNPFDASDPYLYAADPMQLQMIRQDVQTGERQIIAQDARLLDFPSSLAFVPPPGNSQSGHTTLLVVSNQQERTPLTNDAVSEDAFELPFLVTKVVLHD